MSGPSDEGAVGKQPLVGESLPPDFLELSISGEVDPELVKIVRLVLDGEEGGYLPGPDGPKRGYQREITEKLKYLEALVRQKANVEAAWASLGMDRDRGSKHLRRWRGSDETFKKLEDEVFSRHFPGKHGKSTGRRGAAVKGKRSRRASANAQPHRMKNWRRLFIKTYAETGLRTKAAEAIKIKLTELQELLDKSNSKYDEEFAASVREVELARLYDLEDKLFQDARASDAATGRFMLQSHLPDTYKPAQQQGGQNIFWMSTEGEKQVVEMMKEMYGGRDADSKQIMSSRALLEAEGTPAEEVNGTASDEPAFDADAFVSAIAPADA